MRQIRGTLVTNGIGILRAFIHAERPSQADPLGSFEVWSHLVRDAILWLGEADPVDVMDRSRSVDPATISLRKVMTVWDAVFAERGLTSSEAVRKLNDKHALSPEEQSAALDVCEMFVDEAGLGNSLKLGNWLSKHKGKILDGRRFLQDGQRGGSSVWRLAPVAE